jgi:ABC-type spermidine/putrescine transport system permease subunit I
MILALKRSVLIWPALILLVLFYLVPSVDVMRASLFDPDFTAEHFERIFDRPVFMTMFWRTVGISLFVAFVGALIAWPVAYYINAQPRRNQFVLIFLVFVPMWMSVLIRSYAWLVVLGREGFANAALVGLGLTDEPVQLLYTAATVQLAMLQILLPIQIVTTYGAMTEIDMDLMRAARILGANRWQALRRVFVPLSFDGAMSGLIVAFMLSMGFFITPALLGGPKQRMLGNMIETQVGQLNWGFAAALGMLLLVGTLGFVFVLKFAGRLALRALK